MLARLEDQGEGAARDLQDCDLGALLADIIRDMEVLAAQKNIVLAYAPAPGILITGSPGYLRQVFVNILDNAIKYSSAGGTVTVTVTRDGPGAHVAVHDTGCGIPEQELPHIFDRFYRIDKSRATIGFGLGLSIAQSIVAAHNGTITAASSPAQGTTFTVRLPATDLKN
jgi:two-component system phosphate regulon sensor histidine kinase PhoR